MQTVGEMTTIPVLLSMGHRLCSSLLTEARLALVDADWLVVNECLHEATVRLESQMQAEEAVLLPRLAGVSPEADAPLVQCRNEHQAIRARMHAAAEAAARHDKVRCAQTLSRLFDLFYAHSMAEERRIYALTHDMDDAVLETLAHALSKPADQTPTPPASGAAASRRPH